MPKSLDLAGQRFGRMSVEDRSGKDSHGAWMWRCTCDCGKSVLVRGATLKAGRTSACASCATTASSTSHGGSTSALYRRWRAMLNRCESVGRRDYGNYGGRGINVCAEWHDFAVFRDDMGASFNEVLELDRVDNAAGYDALNCRWVSRQQQQNNRRNNNRLTLNGATRTVAQWSAATGVKANTIIYRIRRGWPVERALLDLANEVTW